jgi:hypothetical protein
MTTAHAMRQKMLKLARLMVFLDAEINAAEACLDVSRADALRKRREVVADGRERLMYRYWRHTPPEEVLKDDQ